MKEEAEKKTSIREKLANRKNSQTKNISSMPKESSEFNNKDKDIKKDIKDIDIKDSNTDIKNKIKKIIKDKNEVIETDEKEEYNKLLLSYNELLEKYQRMIAEFDNFRKRTTKEKLSIYDSAVSDTIEKILPVLDNFERALNSATENDRSSNYYKGVEMVSKQFLNMLTEIGVKVIEVNSGDDFNHELHDAVAHIDDENFGENKIVDVLEKGYKYKEKIIRYSKVRVAN